MPSSIRAVSAAHWGEAKLVPPPGIHPGYWGTSAARHADAVQYARKPLRGSASPATSGTSRHGSVPLVPQLSVLLSLRSKPTCQEGMVQLPLTPPDPTWLPSHESKGPQFQMDTVVGVDRSGR